MTHHPEPAWLQAHQLRADRLRTRDETIPSSPELTRRLTNWEFRLRPRRASADYDSPQHTARSRPRKVYVDTHQINETPTASIRSPLADIRATRADLLTITACTTPKFLIAPRGFYFTPEESSRDGCPARVSPRASVRKSAEPDKLETTLQFYWRSLAIRRNIYISRPRSAGLAQRAFAGTACPRLYSISTGRPRKATNTRAQKLPAVPAIPPALARTFRTRTKAHALTSLERPNTPTSS